MTDPQPAVDTTESASNSTSLGWLARLGLVARGVVYLMMGWLAVLLGTGGRERVDQRSALLELLRAPLGGLLVGILAAGFVAYALWRFSEAAFGVPGDADSVGPRLKSFARGVVYSILAVTAISLLLGARGTQSKQQQGLAADVMGQPGGRWLIGLVGVVIVVIGCVMMHEGWSKKFVKYFGAVPSSIRSHLIQLGRVGTIARGLVFAIAGILVMLAAWKSNPERAGGVDEVFQTLLDQPYGPALVVVLGAGLIVFGIYGLAEAAYRRVPGDA